LRDSYQKGVTDPVTVGKKYKYFLEGAWGQFLGEANGHYTIFKRMILAPKMPLYGLILHEV